MDANGFALLASAVQEVLGRYGEADNRLAGRCGMVAEATAWMQKESLRATVARLPIVGGPA